MPWFGHFFKENKVAGFRTASEARELAEQAAKKIDERIAEDRKQETQVLESLLKKKVDYAIRQGYFTVRIPTPKRFADINPDFIKTCEGLGYEVEFVSASALTVVSDYYVIKW